MYTPTNSINLKDVKSPQLMVGLLGEAATGKTTSAATFPNPHFADFNRGLTQFIGRANIQHTPFYDDNYCLSVLKMARHPQAGVVNKRDGFKKWLKDEAIKLTNEQTLVLDSWTDLQNAFDRQTALEPAYTKSGSIDEFDFWARKIDFSRDVMETLKGLACHVVVVFHEQKVRDEKSGELLDKISPLMQGKFVNQLSLYFSDFFRCIALAKTTSTGKPNLVDGKELPEAMNYLWQIKPNNMFNAKTRMSNRTETYVKAHYSSFNY